MEGFFSTEGPLISFFDKAGRIIILGIIWFIFCLPVITIAASSTAFYYSMVKTVRHERSTYFKEFMRCFKRVFKKTILLSIGIVVAFALLLLDIIYWRYKETGSAFINMNLCILFLLLLFPYCVYLFAVLSRFKFGFKRYIKFTFEVMLRDLPYTILILFVLAASAIIIYLFYIAVVFVPGLSCFIITYIVERVLKKYIPKPEDGNELWYDE